MYPKNSALVNKYDVKYLRITRRCEQWDVGELFADLHMHTLPPWFVYSYFSCFNVRLATAGIARV